MSVRTRGLSTPAAGDALRGSGHEPEAVADLIKRFNGMKQMMSVLGTNPGLLGNLPGFKQFAAMQKMKGMDPSKMFGEMLGMPALASRSRCSPARHPERLHAPRLRWRQRPAGSQRQTKGEGES